MPKQTLSDTLERMAALLTEENPEHELFSRLETAMPALAETNPALYSDLTRLLSLAMRQPTTEQLCRDFAGKHGTEAGEPTWANDEYQPAVMARFCYEESVANFIRDTGIKLCAVRENDLLTDLSAMDLCRELFTAMNRRSCAEWLCRYDSTFDRVETCDPQSTAFYLLAAQMFDDARNELENNN